MNQMRNENEKDAFGGTQSSGRHQGRGRMRKRIKSILSITLVLALMVSTGVPVSAGGLARKTAEPVRPDNVVEDAVSDDQISEDSEETTVKDRKHGETAVDNQESSSYRISLTEKGSEYEGITSLQVSVSQEGEAQDPEVVASFEKEEDAISSSDYPQIIWLGSFAAGEKIEIQESSCFGIDGLSGDVYGYGTPGENYTTHQKLDYSVMPVTIPYPDETFFSFSVPSLPESSTATIGKWAVAMEIKALETKAFCSRLIFVPIELYSISFDEGALKGKNFDDIPKTSFVKYFPWNEIRLSDSGEKPFVPIQVVITDLQDTTAYSFEGWKAQYDGETAPRQMVREEGDPAQYYLPGYGKSNLIGGDVSYSPPETPGNITIIAQWNSTTTYYNVSVDQASLKNSTIKGSIPSSFSDNDEKYTFTGIPEDTEQYTFDGWQYRFADEDEKTVRHDVAPDEQGRYVISVKGRKQDLYLYAKWREKTQSVTSITVSMNGQNVSTVSISNEVKNTPTASLSENCAVVKIEVMPQPAGVQEALTIVPDNAGFFGMSLSESEARQKVFNNRSMTLPFADPGQVGEEVRTFYVAAARSGFDNTPVNMWTKEGRRSGAVKLSIMNGDKTFGEITVCINGYDSEAEGYYEDGVLVKSSADKTVSRNVAEKAVYFDTEGVRVSGLTVSPAELYLPAGGAKATLKTYGSEDDIEWNLPEPGEDKLFKSAITPDAEGNTANMEITTGKNVGKYTFTPQEKNFSKSAAKAQSVVSVFGLSGTISGSDAQAFTVKDAIAPGTWSTKLDYSKERDGTIKADSMILTVSGGNISGVPKTGTITLKSSNEKVVTADPASLTLTAVSPGKATVTLVYDNSKSEQGKVKEGTGEAGTDEDAEKEQNTDASVTLTLNVKVTGSIAESGETISEPGQPEDRTAWNLFYTDYYGKDCMTIPMPEGATVEGVSGKWTEFYSLKANGELTVRGTGVKERKQAAQTKNSLISLPIKDSEGNMIGSYEYQLPVFYQKPTLRLTSTSGTVNTENTKSEKAQPLVTTVMEKKSTGALEKLDLSGQKKGVAYYVPAAKTSKNIDRAEMGDDTGDVRIWARGKTAGKIHIQLENWVESVDVSYSVKEVKKNVLTADKKQLIMNVAGTSKTATDQKVILLVNGSSEFVKSDDPEQKVEVSAVMPANWKDSGIEVDGITDGKVTSSEIVFKYGETSPVKGNYSIKFTTPDKASVTLKIVVCNTPLNKAITLKTQAKLNLTTGQKMVLLPNLKGVGGPITGVKFDEENAKIFNAEYIEELNEILISPAEGATPDPKTTYSTTLSIKAGGFDCPVQLKFKPSVTGPAVKINAVTIPANQMGKNNSTASNLLCTFKQGGKTYAIEPTDVKFTGATAAVGEEEGWYSCNLSKTATCLVKYEKESGRILLKNATGKGSVKVEVIFPGGKTVKKSFAVKAKNS